MIHKSKKNILINFLLAIVSLCLIFLAARYYNHYVSAFTDVAIESQVLNESRKVFIRVPNNFDKAKKYGLIIKTDGNFNLDKWDSSLTSLSQNSGEQFILVSIPNLFFTFTRNRDLVPPYARQDVNTEPRPVNEAIPEANGEADKFLQFIELELLPYLESHYKLNNKRILSGFSAGGSFTLYALHTKPKLFNGYFAFSPAAWYDDMTVVNNIKLFLQAQPHKIDTPTYLYLSVGGAEHPLMLKAFNELKNVLDTQNNQFLIYKTSINPKAEHNDNPVRSVEQALNGYQKFINR